MIWQRQCETTEEIVGDIKLFTRKKHAYPMNCLVLPTMGMNYPTVNLFIWIKTISFYLWRISNINIICYRLFAEANAGSYPHAAPQYHDRPKAKRGIAVLNVDEFLYPRQ